MALPLRVGILVRLQQGWDGYKARPTIGIAVDAGIDHTRWGRSVGRRGFRLALLLWGFVRGVWGWLARGRISARGGPFGSIVVSIRPGVRNYLDGSSVAQDDLVASLHAGPNGPGDPVGHRR